MPSSIILDMERSSTGQVEADQRAFQIALELSMLGLTNDDDSTPNSFDDIRSNKKSMNTTECVPVPSSEHVAEIVGRQGCKIKALRAKTNTYIKTPVRGEDPVFVVTGRKEDVALAKREIVSAAEHFSQIRAQRKNNTLNSLAPGPPSPGIPGQTTVHVRVPYRVVGLVVGPKGATIKRIQQQTNTYIVTPSRDKEPVFEVTGAADNVESARSEILDHISNRTGGVMDANDDNVFHNGELNSLNEFRNGSIYSSGSQSSFSSFRDSGHGRSQSSDSYYYGNGSTKINDGFNPINSPFSPNGFFFNDFPSPTERDVGSDNNSSGSGGFDPAPTPPSPSIWAPVSAAPNSFSRSSSINGSTLQNSIGRPASPQNAPRRLKNEALPGTFSALQAFTPFTTQSASSVNTEALSLANGNNAGVIGTTTTTVVDVIGTKTSEHSETNNNQPACKDGRRKECVVCYESEVVAALVPCGHNLFCMECADKIREENSACPVCQKQVIQVLRIFS